MVDIILLYKILNDSARLPESDVGIRVVDSFGGLNRHVHQSKRQRGRIHTWDTTVGVDIGVRGLLDIVKLDGCYLVRYAEFLENNDHLHI